MWRPDREMLDEIKVNLVDAFVYGSRLCQVGRTRYSPILSDFYIVCSIS